ncbi:MAG: O-antigen ligase family protein [Oscillospiraceae bacterium]|nr:O-antigen ligase family protein [Oscillospiraceae bacterium]
MVQGAKAPKISFQTYLMTFLLIYLSSAFELSVYTGTARLLMYLALFIMLVLICVLNHVNLRIPLASVIVFILALLSNVYNTEHGKTFVILISYYVLAILFVGSIDVKKWLSAYAQVMFIIAVASIIIYFLYIFVPRLLSILPVVKNVNGQISHSVLVAISPINNRNYGLFWEPGAFQTYLTLALLVELFQNKMQSVFKVIVLCLALITTFSTAGYLVLALILLCAFSDGIFNRAMHKPLRIFCIVLIVVAVVAYYIIQYSAPSLYGTLFGKVERYFQTQSADSSAGVRISSFVDAFRAFFDNPIFGVGSTNLKALFLAEYGHTMTTCTFANWFAMFGFLYGSFMCYGLYSFTKAFSEKIVTRILLFCVLLACIASEDYVLNPSIIIWNLYGFSLANKQFIIWRRERRE